MKKNIKQSIYWLPGYWLFAIYADFISHDLISTPQVVQLFCWLDHISSIKLPQRIMQKIMPYGTCVAYYEWVCFICDNHDHKLIKLKPMNQYNMYY